MTLDIRGGKKTTGISENRFVVFEELISNAIDSYLIRKDCYDDIPPLSIRFDIEVYPLDLVSGEQVGVKVVCKDNGAGLGDQQVKAFVTKDSTFKDDLKIKGIGKCFGSGRVQYFHFFEQLKIDSVFESDSKIFLRTLNVANNTREISEGSFLTSDAKERDIETTVSLTGLSREAARKHFSSGNIPTDFSARNLRHHIFITFLHRLIALKNVIGDFCIEVSTKIEGDEELQKITSEDLPENKPVSDIPIICSHGNADRIGEHKLSVSLYEFFVDRHVGFEHEVALCANSSIVKSITRSFLKVQKDRKTSLDGKFYIILFESDYLERNVNVRRDSFNIPLSCGSSEMFSHGPSMEDIIESIEDFVLGLLTPTDFDRDALIKETGVKFGISSKMLFDARVKVKYGDTAEKIAKRVLKKYQEEIIDDTAEIFDLKQELLALDPRHSDFRDKVNEMSWKYTSTIKKMDMANLSQLVVRRSSMIEVLSLAVGKSLAVQTAGGRKENEKIIHNIFFPTGKDSNDNIDHDIWILNEEYHYFDHIASDKALASIPWQGDELLFDADVDERLEELFRKNNKENGLKRPDIAIFNQEGAAIIIEFKAPGVELQEHDQDLIEYARLLAARSKGKINKFYGYLIGDSINENRLRGYTKFSSGRGYFGTDAVVDLNTRIQYGELYSEILFYEDFVDRAEKRLKVYKEKLGIG
ncbi:hypothetical protein [Rheinheimera soli]|uniref:hypothetical protein n=1 Tax=Rheinheimera soli TaxID=443616 RepID=UPI001E52E039|nr:hypothetical protein [Rheinheimera soli]